MKETYDTWKQLHPHDPYPFIVYDRESSTMQGGTDGPRQAECRQFAAENDIDVVDVLHDEAKSGTTTVARTAYRDLIAEAMSSKRRFVGVLVFSSSRWGRGDDSEMDQMMLEQRGIKFVSVTEPAYSIGGIHGELIKGIMAKVNKFYSAQNGAQTSAMMAANARDGMSNGGAAPDGYSKMSIPTGIEDEDGKERFKKRLTLDEQPGPYDTTKEPRWRMARTAIDLCLKQGLGLKAAARELSARGFRQKSSNRPLGQSHVRALVRNPRYVRECWNVKRWRRVNGRRRWFENPPEAWVWAKDETYPPIMSRGEFDQLWLRFSTKKQAKTTVRRQLLAGLLECAHHDDPAPHFVVNSRKKTNKKGMTTEFAYLVCSSKPRFGWSSCPVPPIGLSLVEEAVEELVLSKLTAPEFLEAFLSDFEAWTAADGERRQAEKAVAERKIAKLRREIDNLVAAVAEAGGSSARLGAEIRRREEDLAELERKLLDGAAGGIPAIITSSSLVQNGSADLNAYNRAGIPADVSAGRSGRATKQLKADLTSPGIPGRSREKVEPATVAGWSIAGVYPAKNDEMRLWGERVRAAYFASEVDVRRAVLTHVVRKVVIDKKKSGRIVLDPTALLTLRNIWPDLPAEFPVRFQTGCGGWI